MARIFISYRRKDAAADAGRLYDRLIRRFGEHNVTFDVDSIPPGIDFRDYIREKLDSCDCLLVIIGDRWLELLSQESQNAVVSDWARFEIETALQRGIPVVPVLVGQARLATADQLPATIADLSYRNAIEVRSDGSFDGQMARLIEGIERTVPSKAPPTPSPTSGPRRNWKKPVTIAVVLVAALMIVWQWKSIRREVFGISATPATTTVEARGTVDDAIRDAAAAVEEAADEAVDRPSPIPKRLAVRVQPEEQETKPGEVASIAVVVRGADNRPLTNARVTVSAGGGRFLNSENESFDPQARLHEPYSVVGRTTSRGLFRAFWVCNPCAPGYRLMINVASNGYAQYTGNVTIKVDSSPSQ